MKVAVLVAVICLVPALVMALQLNEVAKKERARRLRLASVEDRRQARSFNDADLEIYHRLAEAPSPRAPQRAPVIPSRDLLEERAFWRKEKSRHDREVARLDAQIRRLEWRLAERRARRKPGERLRRDATEQVLEDSIQSLREEKQSLIEAFRERARKEGALPGWVR